jgi:hypothetical protein
MGPLGFAVEAALAAEPAGAPPALGRQGHREAFLEVLGVDAAGQGRLLEGVLLFQFGQQGRVAGADLVFGQAGDALDVEVAGRQVEDVADRTAGVGDAQGGGGGRIAVEADDEQAGGPGAADGLVVEPDVGPRRGAAEGEAALLVGAGQAQGRRRGKGRARKGRGGETEEGGAPVQDCNACQRFRASAGPA